MSSLHDKVYEFVKNIPRGKVATYGQIALHLGNRKFARVVGNILHGNPDPEHIPCPTFQFFVFRLMDNLLQPSYFTTP